jgi:hypothetical protein
MKHRLKSLERLEWLANHLLQYDGEGDYVEVAAQLKQDVKSSGTHAYRIFPLIYGRCSNGIPFLLDILPPVESTTNMGYWNLILLEFIVSYDANIHEIQEYAEAEHHYYEMKEVPIISPAFFRHLYGILHGILPPPELDAQHYNGPHHVQRGQSVVHYVFKDCQSQLWDIIFGVVWVSRNSSYCPSINSCAAVLLVGCFHETILIIH